MNINIIKENFLNTYNDSIFNRKLSNTTRTLLLTLIVLFCLGIRLATIKSPALDRTDWKEIDHITISTNYYEHGFNFFKPEISWPAEPPYVTAMEFPLVPYVTSFLYPIFGINVYTVRFLTLLTALLLVIYLYKLTRDELGDVIALCSAFVVSILPLNNPFGKYLFSEPTLIFFSVFSIYYLSKYIELHENKHFIFAVIGFTIALSLKPTAMYLLLPFLWLYYRKYKLDFRSYKPFLKFFLISLIIPVAWYAYAYYLEKTSIDVFGIFIGHDKFQTLTMLTSAKWYKIMYGRISSDILGHNFNILFVLLGLTTIFVTRKGMLFVFYLLAILSFFVIVAEGNIDTAYRQLTIIPVASVMFVLGVLSLIVLGEIILKSLSMKFKTINEKILKPLFSKKIILSYIIISVLLFYGKTRIFRNDPSKPIFVDCWKLAQEISHNDVKGTKIIAAGAYTIDKGGNDLSPVIYYYAGVTGWTLSDKQWNMDYVRKLINRGATFFAAYHMFREPKSAAFIQEMKNKYHVVYENDKKSLLLLKLDNTNNNPVSKDMGKNKPVQKF